MDRSASAVWKGSLKEGSGTISTQSGTLKDTQYSFKARFADGVGTNPEELIAAAHAGCFTMALSAEITKAGLTPDSIETTAALTLDVSGEKPTITKIHLTPKPRSPASTRRSSPNSLTTPKSAAPSPASSKRLRSPSTPPCSNPAST